MGKIKNKVSKTAYSFLKYLPLCFLACALGCILIDYCTNFLQQSVYTLLIEINYNGMQYIKLTKTESVIFIVISNLKFILMPLWAIFCVILTGMIFYDRELREPIESLIEASRKISENELDFKINYSSDNELSNLCDAFDNMRESLCRSNTDMWRAMEERKRLNAAFSHDMRTPLTVMRGYTELLQKYGDTMPTEKRAEIISAIHQQTSRLEKYTQKMNAVQKLEDIIPKPEITDVQSLIRQIEETCGIICGDTGFSADFSEIHSENITIDCDIFFEVCENLISNAARYAKKQVNVSLSESENFITVSVCDDGKGFSDDAAKKAAKPFYRDDNNSSQHFGLGLYICSTLCRKCDGNLNIGNSVSGGGMVKASFRKNYAPAWHIDSSEHI